MPNLKINNNTYSGVENIEIPLADGSGNGEFAYINPTVKSITANGTHDVTHYGTVNVAVPTDGDGITPTGTKTITANGIYDVTEYASANVSVPTGEPTIRSLNVTANGTYTAPNGVDGYSPVIVNVASGGGGGLPSGVSKLASGTIIPKEDVAYLDAQHGLGVAPNFLVWFVENDVGTTGVASMATDGSLTVKNVRLNTTSSTVYNVHYVSHGYNASTAFGQIYGKYSNNTDMTATIARMRTSAPYYFKAGYTYRWVCGVLDGIG